MFEPGTTAPTTCFHHTDRETGRRCSRCGRPACWECLRDAPVGAHCWQCVKTEVQPPLVQRVRRALRDPLIATKTIIGLVVAAWVVQLANGSPAFAGLLGGGGLTRFDSDWVLYGPAIAAGEWWRIVTSAFLHLGVLHILFNMLILYRLGQEMEGGIGRARFATLYVTSLLAGSFGAVLFTPGTPTLGASGAVFGVAGAATVALFQRGVRFYQTGWGPLLVVNLVISLTLPGISLGAHVGGLLAGVAVGWVMLHPRHGVRSKTLAFALAAVVALASFAGTIAAARTKYGTCTKVQAGGYHCDRSG